MRDSLGSYWKRALAVAATVLGLSVLTACGGGDTSNTSQQPTGLEAGDASDIKLVLNAVPSAGGGGGGGGGGNTVRLNYHRPDGDYAGWTVYVYNAPGEALGSWPGKPPMGDDPAFGKYWDIPVSSAGFNFIIVKDGGGTREPSGWSGQTGGDAQQFWSMADGNTIYKLAGDTTNFKTNPLGAATPDLTTVRVHYKRFDGNFADWGVHIWATSGLDVAGLKPGVVIDQWTNAVPFNDFNNFSQANASEVVFDIPVLNPKADDSRKSLEFIIHGKPPGGDPNNKDGRVDNIKVTYSALTINNQVGEIWLVQDDATVYTSRPDSRVASSTDARAYWLTRDLIKFPKGDASGVYKLYRSATGQIKVAKDAPVEGADGSITLNVFNGTVPPAAAERFKFVPSGVVLQVKSGDRARLPDLHKEQLVLVQEDSAGLVQNATTAQIPGALDDLYAAAGQVPDLGVRLNGSTAQFKLWAPTAQKVSVAVYNSATDRTVALLPARFDKATGIWTARGNAPAGYYYRYVVEVFVRGVGLVRNLVTDPYSISLSMDSARSYIHDLSSPALKPAGWDGSRPPAKVQAQTDMSIYELHVRDFSANDASVSLPNRGKYMAFTETGSNGMRHLRALADAGLTDVHLLPVFDIATVPEGNCAQIATGGAPDSERQQADVNAVRDTDCFNWGYDPFHFNAPEGSFASSAGDGARRIIELRAMVQALHAAGLRVGMDVVYNHTTASGQNLKSVLDRVVPGYYHRLSGAGEVEKSTCCDNTATEHMMMGKLMIDSAVLWATEYGIDSFRFDLMGHQPRSVMEELQAAVNSATGRQINLIGEGWNFGEVVNNARFRQASQLELNGSGIGTFSDRARDYVRGGSPFDGGDNLIRNQGYVNGLFYDPNDLGGGRSKNDLMWAADVIKVGLAGSIRSYVVKTHWDATLRLEEINYNGQPAGYVTSPAEVVNYVENHDNQTLFDINAFKMPVTSSTEDRARVQMLAAAINAFSQGVAYYHAGIDTLRSKSLDRDSYNSGDWFNRIDWTYQDNYFGTGLPIQDKNGDNWGQMRPLLANGGIKPTAGDIGWTRDAFRDLLRIRASSTLFRMRTADDIKSRLTFHNVGSTQVPTVLAGHLNGAGYAGAGFKEVLYLVNVDKVEQTLTIDALKGKSFVLHPVQASAGAADKRPASAAYNRSTGRFSLPARTAVVFVVN
jgi:pullulanase